MKQEIDELIEIDKNQLRQRLINDIEWGVAFPKNSSQAPVGKVYPLVLTQKELGIKIEIDTYKSQLLNRELALKMFAVLLDEYLNKIYETRN